MNPDQKRLMRVRHKYRKICCKHLGVSKGNTSNEQLAVLIANATGWVRGASEGSKDKIRRYAEEVCPTIPRMPTAFRKPRQRATKSVLKAAAKLATPIPRIGAPHPDYVRDDGFYKTREWKQLRYLALRNCSGCQCCGAKAADGVQLHVDHIMPRYKYPHLSLVLDNLQVLCEECNIGKGAWDDTDWREHMRSI